MPPDKKTSWGKRERYSSSYAVFLILALMKLLWMLPELQCPYIKFIKPKQSAKVRADPDDYEFEDEEYESE